MDDPRENAPYEPRQELKDKLAGYTFTKEGHFLKIQLCNGQCTLMSERVVMQMKPERLKEHLQHAANQDEIKKHLIPPAEREADME